MSDRIDPKLRELTYRLIAMAPEAPPFPEEAMVQLKPSAEPAQPWWRRNPLVWVAAAAAVALVIVGVPLILFSGGDEPGPTTVPAATATTSPDVTPTTVPDEPTPTTQLPVGEESTLVFSVYLFSDDMTTRLGDPALVAVQRTVTGAPVESYQGAVLLAIQSLVTAEVPTGFSSVVPSGIGTVAAEFDGSTVRIDLGAAFESGGGTASMFARLAQVVFTATQFPEVDSVLFTRDGEPIDVFSGEGIVLDGPQTRADYLGTDQLIYVDTPAIGSVVRSPFTISGHANTFEANVEWEITLEDGTLVTGGFTTATCGNGCWGDFAVEAEYVLGEDSPGFVTVFETSAEDGSRQHVLRYPVTLSAADPTGDAPSFLYAGYDPMYGTGSYPGRIVATSPLPISVATDADAAVTVNGNPVTLDGNGAATVDVELVEGENTIVVAATRGGQTTEETIVVRFVPGATTEFTFITRAGTDEIVADYAQWLTGDEANQAAFEDGVISSVEEGVPNDYYIRNVNPQLRTLAVADDVEVVLVNPVDVGPIGVPVADWVALFKPDGTPWDYDVDEVPSFPEPYFDYYGANVGFTPYWLVLDADGTVIQIEQQYIP